MSDFFNLDASEFGTSQARTGRSNRVDPKIQFEKVVKADLERLGIGESRGHMYSVQSNDTVRVTLRNGNRLINKDKPDFICKNREMAVGYLNAAMKACAEGKFDAIFEQHVRRF